MEKINEPRYPSFKGIMAAKKKPLTTLSAGTPASRPTRSGSLPPAARWRIATPRPPKQEGEIVKDEGDGGSKLAEFLASQKFI